MILPDINLLVYAYNQASGPHAAARQWWEGQVRRGQIIGIPWAVSLGFIRLVTHARVLADPLRPLDALSLVRIWLDLPNVRVVEPGTRHLSILEELFRVTQVGGSLTTDTHLAALAIEHQAELCSNDSDFARFPGLRWFNPLV